MTDEKETPAPQAQTKDLTPKLAKLTWKAVEKRHRTMAQTIEKERGRVDYRAFVLSLLEAVDGVIMTTERRAGLGKETVAQACAEFEEKWGGGE